MDIRMPEGRNAEVFATPEVINRRPPRDGTMHDPSRYDDKNGFFKEQPDKKSYELASKCRVKGYAHVAQDLSQMKVPWAPKMPAPLQIDV